MSAWKIQHAHHWVMKPYTKYEMQSVLQVRECRQTVTVFDKKYYDCDTNTFVTDKLHSLNHVGYSDIVCDDSQYYREIIIPRQMSKVMVQSHSEKYRIPMFTPRDDDWEVIE